MSLTVKDIDSAIRAAKATGKPVTRFDERGLYILTKPSGVALWRLKFMFNGIGKLISLGQFPDVTLKMARDRRDDERRKIAEGINPADERRRARDSQGNTFKTLAEEWLNRQTDLIESTVHNHRRRLERFVYPQIGSKPIEQIAAQELLLVLRKIENKGKIETAKRTRELCSCIWRYAVTEGKAPYDIAASLKGVIKRSTPKSFAAITDPRKFGGLLRAIDGYDGSPLTARALKLAPMLFVRPGELRHMEWSELDLASATWRIPAEKMKMRDPHIVPLSKQAIEVLNSLKPHSGDGRYVFPALGNPDRPMSENTLNGALRRLGYSGDVHVAHGFRSSASSMLNERGHNADVIELQLAHKPRDVRSVYNRATRLDERHKMMQEWSDYMDKLKAATE